MLVRVTTLVLKPGSGEQLRRLWQENFLPLTTPERGCIARRLLKSIDEPDRYLVITGWKSREAMESHFASEAFAQFNGELSEILAEIPKPNMFEVSG